jgi:nucleotidyltransferase substrate binding protein (TIGR01987 family)
MDKDKFQESYNNLQLALKHEKEALTNPVFYAAITKSFEVCFEYTWKYLKKAAIKEGLEVFSPRDSIKAAGRLGLIDNLEVWLDDLENRNLSVHDYLGITKQDYLKSIKNFSKRVKRLL